VTHLAPRWLLLAWACLTAPVTAGDLPDFASLKWEGYVATAVGVTRRGTPLSAWIDAAEAPGVDARRTRIVLVGGLDGERRSVDAVLDALAWFATHDAARPLREELSLSVIPCGNPDGLLLDKGEDNGAGGKPALTYYGNDKFYLSSTDVESQYLARWLALHRPAAALAVRAEGDRLSVDLKLGQIKLGNANGAELILGVARALRDHPPQVAPPTPVVSEQEWITRHLLSYIRTPASAAYYDTLPLLACRRLQALGWEVDFPATKLPVAPTRSGSELSGLLYLLEQPSEEELAVLRKAADLAFDEQGAPRAEPPFHNQMSDAVFMNGPLLAGVGALTGEAKYFDACARHQAFMRKLCQRDDHLYRHSPLDEAAWGRGNGFAALGAALMLEKWPENDPQRAQLLKAFQAHLAALKQHQDYTGAWHQVIDRPESYREFTCTAMIGFAMARGVRDSWLDKDEYQPHIERAWKAVKARTTPRGEFLDVCTGTGKQRSLRDYFDREALSGRDARGGSMALLFATEILRASPAGARP
jgi:rhamnogalacturonyl hydrolase YesR